MNTILGPGIQIVLETSSQAVSVEYRAMDDTARRPAGMRPRRLITTITPPHRGS